MLLLDYLRWKNITQRDFGKLVGVSGAQISYIVNGLKQASPDLARRIIEATDRAVTYTDLYDRAAKPPAGAADAAAETP